MFETINQYLAWNDHLSGWAQFVGGALAVYAAFKVARDDRAQAREQADDQQTLLEDLIFERAEGVSNMVIDRIEQFLATESRSFMVDNFEAMIIDVDLAISDYRALPIIQVEDAGVRRADVRRRNDVFYGRRNLGDIVQFMRNPRPELPAHMPVWLDTLREDLARLHDNKSLIGDAIEVARASRRNRKRGPLSRLLGDSRSPAKAKT